LPYRWSRTYRASSYGPEPSCVVYEPWAQGRYRRDAPSGEFAGGRRGPESEVQMAKCKVQKAEVALCLSGTLHLALCTSLFALRNSHFAFRLPPRPGSP
jgi:hypothetical protein